MKEVKILGLCGNARAGKDTFFNISKDLLYKRKVFTGRVAFADELKKECDKFLIKNLSISAFTEDEKEKELIRPFLVTYGTHLRRRLDENCWIKKAEPLVDLFMENQAIPVVTDVRFPNEADWIHSLGGHVIHINRKGFGPANKEEAENEPILIDKSDEKVEWPTLGDPKTHKKEYINIINKTIRSIFK